MHVLHERPLLPSPSSIEMMIMNMLLLMVVVNGDGVNHDKAESIDRLAGGDKST